MFESIKRERLVRRALRGIAKQRVVLVLQPGNILVVENSPSDDESFDVAIRTAHMRGWVDVLHDSVPTGSVEINNGMPRLPGEMPRKPIYRLTEGGWAAIHRSHAWIVATFCVAALSFFAGLATLIVTFSIGTLP